MEQGVDAGLRVAYHSARPGLAVSGTVAGTALTTGFLGRLVAVAEGILALRDEAARP